MIFFQILNSHIEVIHLNKLNFTKDCLYVFKKPIGKLIYFCLMN